MINFKFWKKRLGTYILDREIGRGSMGIVYLGKDPASGYDIALKTMKLSSQFNAGALEDAKSRFLREARILTWLNHPDIVTIYDVGEENNTAYIAMEYIEGLDLTAYSDADTLLPLPTVISIMARSAAALAYAHEMNIVHRDVKPGNIMYNAETDTVKVTDFGISRLTDLSATRSGVILGTPLYMSPEQVMGHPVTPQSDIFALGSTMYKLLSGRLPFEADTDINVMYKIAQDAHPDIRTHRPDLPPALCDILDRALAKDMAKRYQSGNELAEDLRRCAAGL